MIIFQVVSQAISANFLGFLLWVLNLIVGIIGWWFASRRKTDHELLGRIEKIEKAQKRMNGWVQGAFGVNLNGD